MDLFSTEEEKRAELVTELVRIPSPTGGEHAVAEWMQGRLLAEGWDVNREGNNLWLMGAGFDTQRMTLLLLAPLDCPAYEEGRVWREALVRQWERFVRLSAEDRTRNLLFVACAHTRDLGERGLPMVLPLLPRVDEAELAWPETDRSGERGLWEGRLRAQSCEKLVESLESKVERYEIIRMEGERGRGAWAVVRGEEAISGWETLRQLPGRMYHSGLKDEGLGPTTVLGFLGTDVRCSLI